MSKTLEEMLGMTQPPPQDISGVGTAGAAARLTRRIGASDIAPIRRNLLEQAYAQFGDLVGRAATAVRPAPNQEYGLGFAEAARWGVNQGREFVADWFDRAASGFEDSSNKLPMVRMENGLMSLQVDPRILDMFDTATLGAMGVSRVARGAIGGTEQAIREFLEAGARSGGQIIAGRKSRTADLAALTRAEKLDDRMQMAGDPKMEAQKRDYIYRETGWWKGKDGQWRYWLDDSQAKLTDQMIEQKVVEGRPVTTVMQHDLLYDAYPELMQRNVGKIELDPTQPRAGDFRAATGQINMRAPDTEGLRKGVLHEMNHGVQDVEGFAPGGNPEYAQEVVRRRLENDPYLPPDQQLSLDDHALLTHLVNQPFEAYRSLSGEAESRLVEILSGRKPSRNYPPYKRFDVKEDQQLVLTGERDRPVQLSLDPEDGRLPGLPESVALPDGTRAAVEPIPDLRRIAIDFMREKGLDPKLTTDEFRRVNPERGKAIADVFEAMQNDPQNPVVQASYRALVEDVKAQFDALQGQGYKFEFIEPGMADPYAASPRLAIEDLKKNKHLWVYPTDAGFGNAAAAADSATNPLLAPTGVKIGDRELVANDLFRIVHDVWGHAKEGVGFRADGEENAWLQHLPTFRPQSRMALTTETRGQNSWLNFGPHGEANRTASSADTVFAPQKVGDLPAWVMDPNGMPPQGPAKTKAALNIGLKIGDTGELDPDEALAALRGLGIEVTESGIMQSGTEPTLVVGLGRALSPAEAEMLARAVRQEAIAQKVGKKGELFGPGKDKWGPFSEDYFMQLKGLREAAKKGQADPPIFNYSLLEQDPGHRIDLPLYDPPRGTPEREARLLRNKGAFTRLIEFARKGMTNDGLGWYNTEELRQEFLKEWGAEKGQQQYEKFIDLVGATSAGAKTDANLKIASKYYADDVQGLPPAIPPKGSGYGHKAQNLHFENAKGILEGTPLDPIEHPKRSRFAANLKGDWTHSTIDKHNVRALAIASRDKEWVATKLEDTKGAGKPAFWNEKKHGAWDPATFNPRDFVERTRMPFDKIPVTWFESAPKGTAYKALTQLNERLAAELGVTPAQAQAALWLGAGDATGLGSKPIALMKALDQRLSITARKRKITKREALRQMISGENPLLGVAGAASLLPLLADDGDGA